MKLVVIALTMLAALGATGVAQNAGETANWCREGLFTTETDNFKIGVVKLPKNRRAYFYNDLDESCPNSEKCRTKAYVVSRDILVVSKTYGKFACGWYSPSKGLPTVGWVKRSDLNFQEIVSEIGSRNWLGEWQYADNSINLTENKLPGYLNVTGDALWKGIGDNVHIGELDGRFKPKGGVLEYSDGDSEYDCKATIRLVGSFLVVADNLRCGGVNVTFSGVYRKK